MQPSLEQTKVELLSRYKALINKQDRIAKMKNSLEQDKEITKVLEEKNKITLQLMRLGK